MIHSLAGGKLGNVSFSDFAKVQIEEGENTGKIMWFKTSIFGLTEGDQVLVPLGQENTPTKAKVLRIDRNISSQCSPVPFSHAKSIMKKF